MTVSRILFYTAISLALSNIIFFLNLLLIAKPLYILYADLFQLGQVYQGETRALMYNRYLFTVVAPCSFLLGSVLTWTLIAHRRIAFVSATMILIVVLLAVAFLSIEPVVSQPAPHTNTPMRTGAELRMGVFFEITRAAPPRYLLEIRHENGDIWIAGWVSDQGRSLKNSDFWG